MPYFSARATIWSYFSQAELGRRVAPILEVAFAVNFDVLPGELLPQPVKACFSGHPHRLLALRRFHLFVQENVDAERIQLRVTHRRIRRQVQPATQQVGAEVGQRLELREEAFFAREVEEEDAQRLLVAVSGRAKAGCQNQHSQHWREPTVGGTLHSLVNV